MSGATPPTRPADAAQGDARAWLPSALVLAGEFPAPTREQWLAAVDKAIKGRDFTKTLVSTTLDGIAVQPLYTADDVATAHDESGFPGFAPLMRGGVVPPRTDGAWDIRARVDHPDATTANVQALTDLRGGATSLDLVIDASGSGDGISCRDRADLERVLADVQLDIAAVGLRAGAHGAVVAQWFVDILDARGVKTSSGCLGIDPLSALAADGALPQGYDTALADGVALAARAIADAPRRRTFRASGLAASDAGASEAQELAFVLGAGVGYLRALVGAGHDVATAASQIELEIAADVDVFSTIAKARALRHCWSAVLSASGIDLDGQVPGLVRIGAVAAGRWVTAVDPWVNLLRGTAASLAAVVGGADLLTVAAFDSARGLPSDLGRRLARNTQLLLQDESYVGRVVDPGGGSYYVEALTDAMAAAGWARFQQVERDGGLLAALKSGSLAADIVATAAKRDAQIATRKHPITGVSEFPLIGEKMPEAVSVPAPDRRPAVALAGTPTTVTPLPRRRLSEPFEILRAHADAAGARPTVFLANIGTGPGYVPRATFASNAFATGGVQAVGDGGYADAAGAASAFRASGAPVAVICGTDDAYTEQAVAYAAALKAAGARLVYLAGRPGEQEAELRAAGVDAFVGVGTDVLADMSALHELLGI